MIPLRCKSKESVVSEKMSPGSGRFSELQKEYVRLDGELFCCIFDIIVERIIEKKAPRPTRRVDHGAWGFKGS
jgi:hypothetical protein